VPRSTGQIDAAPTSHARLAEHLAAAVNGHVSDRLEAFERLDESPVDCDQTSPHNEKVGLTEADLLFITHRFIRDGLAEPSPARPGIDLPRTACIALPSLARTSQA
jgi:hypothetical protein